MKTVPDTECVNSLLEFSVLLMIKVGSTGEWMSGDGHSLSNPLLLQIEHCFYIKCGYVSHFSF